MKRYRSVAGRLAATLALAAALGSVSASPANAVGDQYGYFGNTVSHSAGGGYHSIRVQGYGHYYQCGLGWALQCFDVSRVYAAVGWIRGTKPNLARVRPQVGYRGLGMDVSVPAGVSFYELEASCLDDNYSYGQANSGFASVQYSGIVCKAKSSDFFQMSVSNNAGVRYGSSWYNKVVLGEWYPS
jgi:hypothetical protein